MIVLLFVRGILVRACSRNPGATFEVVCVIFSLRTDDRRAEEPVVASLRRNMSWLHLALSFMHVVVCSKNATRLEAIAMPLLVGSYVVVWCCVCPCALSSVACCGTLCSVLSLFVSFVLCVVKSVKYGV